MFLRVLFIVTLFTLLSVKNFATNDTIYCGTDSYNAMTQIGGLNITSFGTLKALFIMIDFCDDDEDRNNPVWPLGYAICDEEKGQGAIGPNFLNDIVDETETQNSGTIANATTFFNDMSKGLFKMIGKAYYVRAPHPLSWYIANHQGQEAAYSARDAIQILDQTVDFSDFDRWIDAPYNHTQGQDGVIDMVFICYRRWYREASSFHHEGWYYGSLPSGQVWVDNNQRRITGDHSVNVLNMFNYPKMDVVYHEYGHAWGLNHNYSPGLWSLMSRQYRIQTSFM